MTLKDLIVNYDSVGLSVTTAQLNSIVSWLDTNGFPTNRISYSFRSTDTYIYFRPKTFSFLAKHPYDPEALEVPNIARLQEIFVACANNGMFVKGQIDFWFYILPNGFWSEKTGFLPNAALQQLWDVRKAETDPDAEV